MVQPKKSPTSLRLPDDILADVETWATARGITRNAAYIQLLRRGLAPDPAPPEPVVDTKPLARVAAKVQRQVEALKSKPLKVPRVDIAAVEARLAADTEKRINRENAENRIAEVPILVRKAFNPQPKAGKKK